MFTIGTKIIYLDATDSSKTPTTKEGVVTKIVDKQTVQLDGSKDSYCFAAFLYPDTLECRDFLADNTAMIMRHKQEQSEFMTRTYQFNNELIKSGKK